MPAFFGGQMVASSVTGVSGPGDSQGKYKPQNNCSCSCCCENKPNNEVSEINKIGCFKNYKINKNLSHKFGSKLKIKTC
jgi:hypothetical protein